MPQLHLFFPVEVAETAKARAKAAGKSLSSYLADLVVNEVAASGRKVSSKKSSAAGKVSRSFDRSRAGPSAVTGFSDVSA
jgi:hypothetical protein